MTVISVQPLIHDLSYLKIHATAIAVTSASCQQQYYCFSFLQEGEDL